MSLAATTTELKNKLITQFRKEEQEARCTTNTGGSDLAQLLLQHPLQLGQMSNRFSLDENAALSFL
eukprot:489387-Amphidinium_carterae.1